MKKAFHLIRAAIAGASIAMAGVLAYAAPPAMPSKAEVDALANKLKKSMPGLVIDSLKPAAIPGLWELVAGGDVAYFTADGQYMIQGTLFNVPERRNISEETLSEQRAKVMASINKETLIVYPAKGKAKHTVTVFTDPSCTFCNRLHHEMQSYNDMGITIQYAPYARTGQGTLTSRQLQEVVCSKNPRQMMETFMASPQRNSSGAECKGADELLNISKVATAVGLKGTPYLVTDSGKALSGYMSAKELLAALQGN